MEPDVVLPPACSTLDIAAGRGSSSSESEAKTFPRAPPGAVHIYFPPPVHTPPLVARCVPCALYELPL